MTVLTAAVDVDTITAAILAIAGLLAVVLVAVRGAQIGLDMLIQRGETTDAMDRDGGN